MNIIILGAGEVGKQLAYTLYSTSNNIVVIDKSLQLLNKLKNKLDLLTIHGDCAGANVLIKGGIKSTDLLIAVTGSDSSNILACEIAKHFNVKKTICRLTSNNFFAIKEGYTPKSLGIDYLISPENECVKRITRVLNYNIVVENISFNIPNIKVTGIRIPRSSPLLGTRIYDFPNKKLLEKVRFSAMIRDQKLLMPHGNTILAVNDQLYIAGHTKNINSVIKTIDPGSTPIHNVVIAGGTRIGKKLASELISEGYQVRLIEQSVETGEQILDELGQNFMLINGESTDSDVLDEAGVAGCDAFISTSIDDEENILSCVLAKKKGAQKVITITNKAEYEDIVPGITGIDCGFSPRLVAVNSVLYELSSQTAKIHAILQRINAYIYEFDVHPSSPICDKKISEYEHKLPAILSLVFRNGKMVPVTGDKVLQAHDRVFAVTTPRSIKQLESLFKKKSLFNL